MTTTVPASMLGEIQGCSAAGGFVRSEWRPREQLAIGDLFRHASGWAVITRRSEAVTFNRAHEVIDRSPFIGWRDHLGDAGRAHLIACTDGREVRTDTRIDARTLAGKLRPDPFIVPGDMPGKACSLCGRDMPPGHAGRMDLASWLLCLQCTAPAFAPVPA